MAASSPHLDTRVPRAAGARARHEAGAGQGRRGQGPRLGPGQEGTRGMEIEGMGPNIRVTVQGRVFELTPAGDGILWYEEDGDNGPFVAPSLEQCLTRVYALAAQPKARN